MYISAYARTNAPFSLDPSFPDYNMKIAEWLPIWWSLQSSANRLIILSVPISIILLIAFHKRIFIKKNNDLLRSLIFLFLGILFWFIKAPDPRFGFGFLIPFVAIVICLLIDNIRIKHRIAASLAPISLFLLSAGLLAYSSFRFYYYFNLKNILMPAGISSIPYTQVNCNGAIINYPLNNEYCGDSPVPCVRIECDSVIPRSNLLKDGFRIKR